jgi:8-oxo-dGTP pyrophosphatase MutT (NUDIX family)
MLHDASNMFDRDLPDRLRLRLAQRLPGRSAQRAYSHELSYGRHFGPVRENARQAAVLVLLRWDGNQWLVPLTRRQQGGIHSGQICFAGGGIDPGETVVDAALRECHEETGWEPTKADVIGQLSPIYVYASNNFVSCVVATTSTEPIWNPDEREVAELLEVPLQHLCTDEDQHETTIRRHGSTIQARCFRWQSYEIWGATSMIISELKAVILS